LKQLLLIPALISVANAAIIVEYPDAGTNLATIQYQIFVNPGGNQASATFIDGSDPATLTHTAATGLINDGDMVNAATLDLTLTATGNPNWSREASYFATTPATSTWNPTFTTAGPDLHDFRIFERRIDGTHWHL
jgi:hypothetical protein